MNKKVLFIIESTELGGAERQAILLGKLLKEQSDFLPYFIVFGKQPGLATNMLDINKISYLITTPPVSRFFLLNILRFIKFFIYLRKLRPNILMSYTNIPNVYTGVLFKYTKASKCIWNQRDEGLDFNFSNLVEISKNNVTHFVANASGAKKFLLEKLNVPESKVSLIHNGIVPMVPMINRNDWRKSHNIGINDLVIGMVANLHKNKDHSTLILAFNVLLKLKHKENLILALAGRFDDEYVNLINQCKELGIEDKVLFLGTVNDIANFLNSIDISVLSSKSEGLPNAIIESVLLKVPVTGTRISGIIEVLGDDYSSYLAKPRDYCDLADKIELILDNFDLKKMLIERNFLLATEKFSEERLLNSYIKIFNE